MSSKESLYSYHIFYWLCYRKTHLGKYCKWYHLCIFCSCWYRQYRRILLAAFYVQRSSHLCKSHINSLYRRFCNWLHCRIHMHLFYYCKSIHLSTYRIWICLYMKHSFFRNWGTHQYPNSIQFGIEYMFHRFGILCKMDVHFHTGNI